MTEYLRREITREQYDRAVNEHHNYLAKEDEEIVFTIDERWGYGVYGARVFSEDGKYYVTYRLGSTCD